MGITNRKSRVPVGTGSLSMVLSDFESQGQDWEAEFPASRATKFGVRTQGRGSDGQPCPQTQGAGLGAPRFFFEKPLSVLIPLDLYER